MRATAFASKAAQRYTKAITSLHSATWMPKYGSAPAEGEHREPRHGSFEASHHRSTPSTAVIARARTNRMTTRAVASPTRRESLCTARQSSASSSRSSTSNAHVVAMDALKPWEEPLPSESAARTSDGRGLWSLLAWPEGSTASPRSAPVEQRPPMRGA